jgi:hypothetical protein
MYLISKGGDLNRINNDGHTPIAYDTNRLCAKLNLEKGVVTVRRKKRKRLLHKNGTRVDWDNN